MSLFMMCHRLLRNAFPGVFLGVSIVVNVTPPSCPGAPISFNQQIRPLLAEHCLKCHSGVKEAGGLNLQFREQALQGGKSDLPAIVPGQPDKSEFIVRLTTDDDDDRMPKKADPLSREQIAMFKQWIAEGARWEEHWAYEPPTATGRSIDSIVQTRLKQERLALAPEADRRTLARRTALDIIGLPPSPEEVDAFLSDKSPHAYERWVDRLLASPAYGERWAAVWLDLARYADSKGYEKDGFRDMWRYRDWVIDAFNRDLPYDQFLVEQLGGDLLPNPDDEQIIATAFHRNTPENDEGGTDDEEFRTYAVLDRLNTTFDALQGTTMSCVQCHGHPYDPFVHREYYELMAFFNNAADADRTDSAPTRKFYTRTDTDTAAALEKNISAAQQKLDAVLAAPENRQAFDEWLREIRPPENFMPLRKLNISSTDGTYRVQKDGRVRLEGPVPPHTTITVEGAATPGVTRALVLALAPDRSLPGRGPGASDGGGNFILTHIRATLLGADGAELPLSIGSARASHEQRGWPIAEALKAGPGANGEGEGGWAIAGGTGKPQTATFVFAEPADIPAGATLRVVLECENEHWAQHVLGSFRLATSREQATEKFDILPKDLREFIAREPTAWTADERAKIERHFFAAHKPTLAPLYESLDRDRAALAALPTCDLPIMQELPPEKARVTRIFHRGNWMDQTDVVQPATPKILNPWREEYPRDRLGFARWMTDGDNPLTARVQVNRVWEQLFGAGLVETLEDFGTQGDQPVYQELLDELAVRFQSEMKWSQKALLREIVLSRVYRQASAAPAKLLERDPSNRLLARGPRFRLSSEQLRDQALAVAGILSGKMFGPPVMPYQPPGMWLTPYDGRDWKNSEGEDSRRRALYTFIRRSATYPSFVTFDAPNREFCQVRRLRTNTPLQSLDLLNNPVFFEAAQALARRMETEGGTDINVQLSRGFLLATQRLPRADELAVLKKLHERVDGNLALVANAILNIDEVLNKN